MVGTSNSKDERCGGFVIVSVKTDINSHQSWETIDMQAFLASFFVGVNLHGQADRVRRLKPKRMQISWRDRTILEDNGIYTMRHMESYLGQSVSRWYCGIVKGDRYMLNDLRKKFMHDILVSNINSHKHSVIQRASEHDRNVFGRAS
nr:uncharacterized protein LOC109164944 [Ipomoea batatas]